MNNETEALPLLQASMACLKAFWDDPDMEDILIQKPGEAWVRTKGVMIRHDLPFDAMDAEAWAILAGALKGQNFGRASPLLSCDLPGPARLQAALSPVTRPGFPALAFRRGKKASPTMAGIAAGGIFTEIGVTRQRHNHAGRAAVVAAYRAARVAASAEDRTRLWQRVMELAIEHRLTIGCVGEVGTGKTHFSMGLANLIDRALRILTIQDADEWAALTHPNKVDFFYSKGAQGEAVVDAYELVEAALRMSMHWLLLQEVRGAEALALLRARRSGHASISTWHADSVSEAFPAIAMMTAMHPRAAGMSIPMLEDAWRGVIDMVVHFVRTSDTEFRITDVWLRDAELDDAAKEQAEKALAVVRTETAA